MRLRLFFSEGDLSGEAPWIALFYLCQRELLESRVLNRMDVLGRAMLNDVLATEVQSGGGTLAPTQGGLGLEGVGGTRLTRAHYGEPPQVSRSGRQGTRKTSGLGAHSKFLLTLMQSF